MITQRQKDEARRFAMEAEARIRAKHTGGAPSISYDWRPPFLFDCRLNCARRMGIGDRLVLIAAIQRVIEQAGGRNVRAWFSERDAASQVLFSMAGGWGEAQPDDRPAILDGWQTITQRHHIMEDPLGLPVPCWYGERTGNPVAQIIYSWGWQDRFGATLCVPRITPGEGARKRAADIAWKIDGPFATCSCLEVSRGNDDATPDVWRRVIADRVPPETILVMGCAIDEIGKALQFGRGMADGRRLIVMSEPLDVWRAVIDKAALHITGNTGGLWLAMDSATPKLLLQGGIMTATPHNAMWNYRGGWGGRAVEIIDIERPEKMP